MRHSQAHSLANGCPERNFKRAGCSTPEFPARRPPGGNGGIPGVPNGASIPASRAGNATQIFQNWCDWVGLARTLTAEDSQVVLPRLRWDFLNTKQTNETNNPFLTFVSICGPRSPNECDWVGLTRT
jgi:hypothetical protein